jgi:UDP-4-amino-4,6-dideoxy-N-acetyl-beta-L-altrosamine N-acetyltransferase
MQGPYKLVPVAELDGPARTRLLEIRNDESVRRWMLSDEEIGADEHLEWIARLRSDETQICLAIVGDDGVPLGSVNLKKIDRRHRTAELGFYRTREGGGKGIVTESLKVLINHSFDALGLEKIYSEVIEGNDRSVAMHERLSFAREGFLRSHIVRGDARIGLHLFGLLKGDWQGGGTMTTPNVRMANDV